MKKKVLGLGCIMCASLMISAADPPTSASQAPPQDATPTGVQPLSGETAETEPTPLLHRHPVVPSLAPESDGPEDGADSFTDHMDDKFYHHEAQLRDLYYLQVGRVKLGGGGGWGGGEMGDRG